jgi:hypothetical protein
VALTLKQERASLLARELQANRFGAGWLEGVRLLGVAGDD